MIDVRRDVPQTGKTLATALAFAAVLGVLWLLGNVMAADAVRGVVLLGAGLAAVIFAAKTLSDWRSGVYPFLVWLLFEDLVRKYLGNNMYVYFGKDVLVGATYAALLMTRLRGHDAKRFRVPFKYSLGLFVLLGLAQFFNPGSPSMWYGLLGLKLYFFYVPLMFVGYALVRSERDLHRFLMVNMGLAGIIALVGILQAVVGVDFLNPYSGADIEELSHVVKVTQSGFFVERPTSVFVSDGRFAQYLILAFILGLGTAGYLQLRRSGGRKITLPAVALLAVAAVISGSRGAFVWVAASALVLSAAMLWGAPPRLGEGYRLMKAIRRSFIFVALAIALAVTLFPDVVGARWAYYRETLSPSSPDFEAGARGWNYPAGELLKAFDDRDWPIGHGIGTSSLGGQYVKRIMEAPPTNIAVENGFGSMVLELGILGPILWLAWSLSLIFSAWKVARKLKGTWAFPMASSVLWFTFFLLLALTWGGIGGYENFVLNAYFWLLVGILFRLPALVEPEVRSQEPEVRVSPAAAHG